MSGTIETIAERRSQRGEPTWEVAHFFPKQGKWTEDDYFALSQFEERHIELSNGMLEFLPMTSYAHQFLILFLCDCLRAHLNESNEDGAVLPAPFQIRLVPGLIREPDVIFLRPERMRNRPAPPNGADLLIEIVSAGSKARKRDFETKRAEYAEAGVPEYWIVDPYRQTVHILTLETDTYQEHGVFKKGQTITNVLLPGLNLDIDELFAGKRKEP